MNEETLPPSPNWYLSNVLACTADGTVAYGAKNSIAIAKYLPGFSANRTPQISVIRNAHKERVTVVAFSTSRENSDTYRYCLASAGDDSVIRIWNLETLSPLLAHNAHKIGTKVSAMSWSKFDPNIVVSADETGSIVCWNLFSNTTHQLTFGKYVPTCLACCPHRQDLVAVGTRCGLVCIVCVKDTGKLLYRLRGHESEVVSLAWCPVSYNVLQPENSKEDMLLVSGAKEKSVYIWRAGGDGRYEIILNLPAEPLSHETVGTEQHRSNLGTSPTGTVGRKVYWTCVSWPEPGMILSSSSWGELIAFSIEQIKSVGSNKQLTAKLWRLVHACHTQGLCSIACSTFQDCIEKRVNCSDKGLLSGTEPADPDHTRSDVNVTDTSHIVWTASQDRQLVACCMETGQVMVNVPTLGGCVYCIAASPLDCMRIAFGVGDGSVRIWNLSNSTSIEIMSLQLKNKTKVMALAWHPTNERWLAYGTSEGRVGICDASSGKQVIMFRLFHQHSVYVLCWGPAVYKKGCEAADGFFLYSCADREVVQYDPDKPEEEPSNLKAVMQVPVRKYKRSDIAWKPDYTLLAVGNEDGTVQIMSVPHLTLIHTLFAHKKLIQCLSWHPESTATDTTYSPYRNWLAVASNENDIKVFDLSCLAEGNEETLSDCLKLTSDCITLNGHTNRVVSVCWSPHIGGQLVSVSFDNTAQVWNVPLQQAVANFSSHSSHVYCCVWCPFDPDLVFTGSSDCTLRVWRISTQSNALPSEGERKQTNWRAKNLKTLQAADVNSLPQPAKGDAKICTSEMPADSCDNGVEFATSEKEIRQASTVAISKKKNRRKKPDLYRSFFPVSAQELNQGKAQHLNNCYQLLAKLDGKSDNIQNADVPLYFAFFGDHDAMQRLLDAEVGQHSKGQDQEEAHHLELWRGNVTEMLKEMARRKRLTDLLVSFAPMASQRLWMDMCQAYAEQLELCGQYEKAASYLLLCHKVNEAIELLVNHHLFREALAIAHSRLGPDDPLPKRILQEWSRQLTVLGNYELAAECLISVGDLLEAAMLIRKRNDERSLKLAALLANKAGASDLASMLANQSLKQSLLLEEWGTANEVSLQHPHLKHLKLLCTVHQTIAELAAKNQPLSYWKWLHSCKYLPSEHMSLLELILLRWQSDVTKQESEEIYVTLLKEFGTKEPPNTKQKLWFVVSVELALACVSDGIKRLHHMVAGLGASCQYIQLQPAAECFLLQMCTWISPQGPFAEKSMFCIESTGELKYIARSLQAYLCAGVFAWASEVLDAQNRLDSAITLSGENGADNGDTLMCDGCQNKSEQWGRLMDVLNVSKNSVLTRENIQYFQDCVKIKKWEHEIATTFAKSHTPTGDTSSASDTAGDGGGDSADSRLKKLEELKQRKEAFERDYISTPNPFVVYCKIKSIAFHIKKDDPQSCGDLYEEFEALWKNITSQK